MAAEGTRPRSPMLCVLSVVCAHNVGGGAGVDGDDGGGGQPVPGGLWAVCAVHHVPGCQACQLQAPDGHCGGADPSHHSSSSSQDMSACQQHLCWLPNTVWWVLLETGGLALIQQSCKGIGPCNASTALAFSVLSMQHPDRQIDADELHGRKMFYPKSRGFLRCLSRVSLSAVRDVHWWWLAGCSGVSAAAQEAGTTDHRPPKTEIQIHRPHK